MELEHLQGTVESVIFYNESNGYVVLELDAEGQLVTATGEMGEISEGETLLLEGNFVTKAKYGRQFQASVCRRKLPQSAIAIEKYLASGVIKGVGRKLAAKLVEAFGENTLEIFENEPHRLQEVSGVTPKKAEEILHSFQQTFAIQSLMSWLANYSIPAGLTVKIWKKWGSFAKEIILENPFQLCVPAIGLDFPKVNQLAQQLGMPPDSLCRVAAGMIYVLEENALSGHTCLPTELLEGMVCRALEVDSVTFYTALEQEYRDGRLAKYLKNQRPFTFIKDYYRAEEYIAQRMAISTAFLAGEPVDEEILDTAIGIAEEESGIIYEDIQRSAIKTALSKGVVVLTGGPGTGKTTTVNAILSLMEQQGMRVMLAAPTGRAAKRMEELTGHSTSTIHRLLIPAFSGDGSLAFTHNESNPLACEAVIIDEMSMVDCLLFEALLRALRLNCRIVMVGDSDQLPSVGAGNLLGSLISSSTIPVIRLNRIFRQASGSAIITNAHRIVHGEMPELTQKNSDFFFLQRLDEGSLTADLLDLYRKRLPATYGFNPLEDIQILCPSRKGAVGVVELNKALQALMNPTVPGRGEINGKLYQYRVGDKVMQIKNNYDLAWVRDGEPGNGIFNGDIGYIRAIHKRGGIMTVDFEGRIADYGPELTDQLELAYAITVHKSQGSEFKAVILPLLGGFSKLSYRNLLYTAVTRAKNLLIILGSSLVVKQMVSNDKRTRRYSCLTDLLRKSCE